MCISESTEEEILALLTTLYSLSLSDDVNHEMRLQLVMFFSCIAEKPYSRSTAEPGCTLANTCLFTELVSDGVRTRCDAFVLVDVLSR